SAIGGSGGGPGGGCGTGLTVGVGCTGCGGAGGGGGGAFGLKRNRLRSPAPGRTRSAFNDSRCTSGASMPLVASAPAVPRPAAGCGCAAAPVFRLDAATGAGDVAAHSR